MTPYETYVFLLCLIVFIMLTAMSVVCLTIITKLSIRLIRSGAEDENIIKEKTEAKPKNLFVKILDAAVTGIVCLVFIVSFAVSTAIATSNDMPPEGIPTWRVVNTGSMAEKNPDNKYLFDNKIDNQIQTFDLICTEKLPPEEELELYDIVVYEMDDVLVVHRIIEIEEPNEFHPNERHFRLQGDAVDSPDRFPVLYAQMRAIYSGDRIPFVGSFVLFMQSPAGYLCILLVAVALIAMPILNRKLMSERDKRYAVIAPSVAKEDN